MFERQKQLHKRVFRGETDYIPLCVNVTAPEVPRHTNYAAMLDPAKAIFNAENTYANTKEVGSDVVPMVESNFMECLVPSIFGAQTYESAGGLIDAKPFISSVSQMSEINVTDIFNAEMEAAIKHLEYLKANAPEWLYVNHSRPMSPLDYAVIMRGGDFYLDLAMEPELCVEFLRKIADVTIKTTNEFKKIIDQPSDEFATVRGLIFPGIRLTGDAVVNLSPTMIEEIMCPIYREFECEFGAAMLHYCCTPAPSGHVIGALASGGGINCVDNWQGYRTFFNADCDVADTLQTDIGICTDITKEQILSGEIANDIFITLKGRPLTCTTHVDTVDEGKRVYEKWQEMFDCGLY